MTRRGYPFPPSTPHRVRRRIEHADFHTTWRSELRLWNSTTLRVAATTLLVLLLALPVIADSVWLRIATVALITAIGAMSLTLLTGVAGQLSLGHAAFIGVGAYSAAFVTDVVAISFWWSLPLAMALTGVLGLAVAPIALRVRGLYLAVVTLGLVFLFQHLFRNWTSVTGGVGGARVEAPTIFGIDLLRGGELGGVTVQPFQGFYLVALLAALTTYLVLRNLTRSQMGRDMAAVRDDDLAAAVVGVRVFRAKAHAFVVSSAFAGLAGTLLGGLQRFVGYDQWGLHLSIEYLVMVVLGGIGVIGAAAVGAVFVTVMPELLDRIAPVVPLLTAEGVDGLTPARASVILFGVLVAGVMVAEPSGMYGLWVRVKRYFTSWPFTY